MTVDELTSFAGKNGLKKGRKKRSELIEHILKMLTPSDADAEAINQFLNEVENESHTEEAHHEFYRDYFNGIDLFDRLWYDCDEKHTIINWRSKYIFSLLRASVINLFVCENEIERITWKKFYPSFLKLLTRMGDNL